MIVIISATIFDAYYHARLCHPWFGIGGDWYFYPNCGDGQSVITILPVSDGYDRCHQRHVNCDALAYIIRFWRWQCRALEAGFERGPPKSCRVGSHPPMCAVLR